VWFFTHLPAYEDGTECYETSAYKIQTSGNYPEESLQHSEHGESLKSRIPWIFFTDIWQNPLEGRSGRHEDLRHRTQTPITRRHNLGQGEIRTDEPRVWTAEDSTRLRPRVYFTRGINFMFKYNHSLSRPALRPTQPPIQWVPGLSWVNEAGAWRWPPTPI